MGDTPALHPDLAVGEALRAIAHRILSDARAAIDDPGRSEAVAVHDFRREMKRWRALLRLIEPYLGEAGRQLRMQARELARALGGARDAQSALDALADLAKDGPALPERSLASVRRRLEQIRQAAETVTVTADRRLHLAQTLNQADAAIERWSLHTLTYGDLAQRLARGYRAARRAMPDSWEQAPAEVLHELRKATVTHRHQMEMVVPLWPRFGKMWIAETQRLRSRLGAHHDLLLLEQMTGPGQPLARWRSQLKPAIDRRRAAHVRAARRLAERLFVEKPKAFRRKLEVMWQTSG
jgi:CHAD domain-containing protein